MTVEPFELIENYARHHDAFVRRNVAVAISSVPNDQSIAALLDMASFDPDDQVREVAEQRLATIEPSAAPLLRRELTKRLQSDDPTKKTIANALAGRLHRRGFDLRPLEERLRSKLRMMRSEGRLLSTPLTIAKDTWRRFRQAGISRRLSLRTVWTGFLGGLAPVGFLVFYLQLTLRPSPDVLTSFALCALVLVVILALRIGRREQPLMLQWDEPAAVFRDIVETGLWALLLLMLPATLIWIVADHDSKNGLWLGLAAATVIAAACAAAHIASAAVRYQSTGGTGARLLRYFISLTSGVSVLTAILLIVRQLTTSDFSASLAEALWLFAIPSCGAIALVLARLDSVGFGAAALKRRPSRRHHVVAAALAIPGVVLSSFGLWKVADVFLMPGRWFDNVLASVDWMALSGSSKPFILSWAGPETVYRFSLPFPQILHLTWTTEDGKQVAEGVAAQAITFRRPRARGGDSTVDDQGCARDSIMDSFYPNLNPEGFFLAAGCYELRVGDRSSPRDLSAALRKRTRNGRAAMVQRRQIQLALNVTGAVWAKPGHPPVSVSSTSAPLAWVAARDASVEVDLQSPTEVRALVLSMDRYYSYSSTTAISRRSSEQFEIRGGRILKPGPYSFIVAERSEAVRPRLEAARQSSEPVIPRSESSGLFSAYVMFAQPSTYHWGRRERWLNWNVTQVPSSFRFKLPADGAILAELKVSGAPDMVLELARLDRQVLQAADDPETIQTSLAAGEYNLVVKSYARRSQSGAGIEKLSTPVELVLDRVR